MNEPAWRKTWQKRNGLFSLFLMGLIVGIPIAMWIRVFQLIPSAN